MAVSIKRLIFEKIEPDADTRDPFGKFLFDPNRKDLSPKEKQMMTKKEERFWEALMKMITRNKHQEIETLFPELYSLGQQGKYSKFLVPDPNKPIYRSISVEDPSLLFKSTGLDQSDFETKGDKDPSLWVFHNGTFTPNRNIQSWSISKDVAKEFSVGLGYEPMPSQITCTFVTYPKPENGKFLLNPDNINRAIKMHGYYQDEQEVISMGEFKYDKMITYIPPNIFNRAEQKLGQTSKDPNYEYSGFLWKDIEANLE